MATLYKITSPMGKAINGGKGYWSMPFKDQPGGWMPNVGYVRSCESGYHLIPAARIINWLPFSNACLWEAEGRGESEGDPNDKIAFQQARLIRKAGFFDSASLRLAAADMAEQALPFFLKERPNDPAPANAIQAARDFAMDKCNAATLRRAALASANAAHTESHNGDGGRYAAVHSWDRLYCANPGLANAAAEKALLKQLKLRMEELDDRS